MNILRTKDIGIKCTNLKCFGVNDKLIKCTNPKCFGVNDKLIKCRCNLKNPKKFPCREKYKYSLYYVYDLEIEWENSEIDSYGKAKIFCLCCFADIDITENPFKHSIRDLWDKYYNLSLARKIMIMGPYWTKFHINKYGSPCDQCFCDDNCELVEETDFKNGL